MITIRKSESRGHVDHGWLDTYHSFSFGDYYDAEWMGFRSLRVINDDKVAPGMGFPTHGHRDMEILTYVLDGALEHKDSMGSGGVIRPGEVQYMSAGRGVSHSEFNASRDESCHLLQIWIVPDQRGYEPVYAQQNFGEVRKDRLCLLASKDGRDGSIQIRQDADVFATLLDPGAEVTHALAPGRYSWLQVATGSITLNGEELSTGDAAVIEGESELRISAVEPSEMLLFDLA